ncbi:DUF559 domain-containing protein [Micromonospora sp. CPCC 206061]|uniref:DUF559 domain-containing protein n=1 Tax=Micromonospora sp. CPCC 206061 TaxID=3122410 RepID=UPI002FEF8839
MNAELRALLECYRGVVTRTEACQVVPPWTLESARRAGELRRLLPGVYADTALADETRTRREAALRYIDGRGALSHTTALDVWRLHESEPAEPIHVTVPVDVRLRPGRLVVVHRRAGFKIGPPHVVAREGLPVTRLERSLVDAWPLLPEADRCASMIRAVNDRLTTPERLAEALALAPRFADRAACHGLLDRLVSGCRSVLEVWGHDHVFTGSDLPPFQRQVRVQVGGRTYYLDVYAEAQRVDFELDGAASHGSPAQRDADLRRDALLATAGILVVRFSHQRLRNDTAAVRREIRAILETR